MKYEVIGTEIIESRYEIEVDREFDDEDDLESFLISKFELLNDYTDIIDAKMTRIDYYAK